MDTRHVPHDTLLPLSIDHAAADRISKVQLRSRWRRPEPDPISHPVDQVLQRLSAIGETPALLEYLFGPPPGRA